VPGEPARGKAELLAESARLRGELAEALAPVGVALARVERLGASVRSLKHHPAAPFVIGAAVTAIVVFRPRTLLRALQWAAAAWQFSPPLRRWAVSALRRAR
jgi:hypothetical protein